MGAIGSRGDKKPSWMPKGQERRFQTWYLLRGWRWGCPQHTALHHWSSPSSSAGTWCCHRHSRSPVGKAGLCLFQWWGRATQLERRGDNNQIHQQYKHKQLVKKETQLGNPVQTRQHCSWCFSFLTAIFPKGIAVGFVFPSCPCGGKSISSVMVIGCLQCLVSVKPCALQILTYRNGPLKQFPCKRPGKRIWPFSPGRAQCSAEHPMARQPRAVQTNTGGSSISTTSPTWSVQLHSTPPLLLCLRSLPLFHICRAYVCLYLLGALGSCGTSILVPSTQGEAELTPNQPSHKSCWTPTTAPSPSITLKPCEIYFYTVCELCAGDLHLHSLAGPLHQAWSRSDWEHRVTS